MLFGCLSPMASFDRVMSICAIEHFDDGPASLDEMARVLVPGGELVMSADALTRASEWPRLFDAHCRRYSVKQTYSHERLGRLLAERGLDVEEHNYQFRGRQSEQFYLAMSSVKGKAAPNAAVIAAPLVSVSDRRLPNDGGSVVLVRARKRAIDDRRATPYCPIERAMRGFSAGFSARPLGGRSVVASGSHDQVRQQRERGDDEPADDDQDRIDREVQRVHDLVVDALHDPEC